MTIAINQISSPQTIAVYNGVDHWTECDRCGLLNVPCTDDGAPMYCDTCEEKTNKE